jgi:hypothetical protein
VIKGQDISRRESLYEAAEVRYLENYKRYTLEKEKGYTIKNDEE